MRKMLVAMLFLSVTLTVASTAFASEPPPLTFKPDLSCPLCGIKRAPDVVETQKPAELHPIIRPGLVSLWYFTSYGRNAGTRGPFSSRVDCETARQLLDDTDKCFVDRRYKYID